MRFHKAVYSRSAVEKTLKAFKRLASFTLEEKSNYFILERKHPAEYNEMIEKEFSNYALETAINEKKG
jgi:hypothetical protein